MGTVVDTIMVILFIGLLIIVIGGFNRQMVEKNRKNKERIEERMKKAEKMKEENTND